VIKNYVFGLILNLKESALTGIKPLAPDLKSCLLTTRPHGLTKAWKKISNIYKNKTIWGVEKSPLFLWLLSVNFN